MSKDELDLTTWNYTLEADQMIIWRSALEALADQVEHLTHRAKYYDEFPRTEDDFLDCIEDLAGRIRQIRRTSQGEG